MPDDLLQQFLFEHAPVRGEFVRLERSFAVISQQHPYPPFLHGLLGEALAAVALLSAIIKFKGRLTLQFQGKGKLKLLLAQCNHQFHLRGLCQWDNDLQPADLVEELQKGILVITVDPGRGGKTYQGVVPWEGVSLQESLEGYFRNSEQLATRIWLTADDKKVSGLLLQVIPGEKVGESGNYDEWDRIVHLTDTVRKEELLGLDNETFISKFYADDAIRLFTPVPIMFLCTCSVQRSKQAILLLGREEVEKEIEHKQKIIVHCEFCNKEYVFDRNQVTKIFQKHGDSTLH